MMDALDTVIFEMNNIINDFIQSVDIDYSATYGSDFCAYWNDNSIQWALIMNDAEGEAFKNNFVKRFACAEPLSIFILSLLHEVGHLETEWLAENDTAIRNEKMSIENYFNLYNERIATDWAGEYVQENLDEVKELDKKIMTLWTNFLSKTLDK